MNGHFCISFRATYIIYNHCVEHTHPLTDQHLKHVLYWSSRNIIVFSPSNPGDTKAYIYLTKCANAYMGGTLIHHTHTHTYMYIYMDICIQFFISHLLCMNVNTFLRFLHHMAPIRQFVQHFLFQPTLCFPMYSFTINSNTVHTPVAEDPFIMYTAPYVEACCRESWCLNSTLYTVWFIS